MAALMLALAVLALAPPPGAYGAEASASRMSLAEFFLEAPRSCPRNRSLALAEGAPLARSATDVCVRVLDCSACDLGRLVKRTHGDMLQFMLVLIYANWCPFSARFAPSFHALAQAFPAVRFVAADGDAQWKFSARFMVRGYPALLLFRGGRFAATFSAPTRSFASVAAFLSEHTGMPPLFSDALDAPLPPPPPPPPLPRDASSADWLLVLSACGCALLLAEWLAPCLLHCARWCVRRRSTGGAG